ncbi:hypothetical protein EXIGLDRAFT_830696 [Exidia glandulosa HHB12029]|uniref:NAD(P)-binding domain-containing protein n=1 Tax=Exidia glandulosa HHB12029 TaxID=1314781 RepID=A0A165NCE9_EXIGL|nr:hypothetical protein EXIGLDRAFT_830696 [Exidia glandulosa HHB12029]
MRFLVLGGSRNIGYLSTLRLLAKGHTVTLLVRQEGTFSEDAAMQEYIKSGLAHVVVGDALVPEDVRKTLDLAQPEYIVSSIGGTLVFDPLPTSSPLWPTSSTMPVLLDAMRAHPAGKDMKLIVVSTNGLGQKGHEALPLLMKPMYGWMLAQPHLDKMKMERILGRASGHPTWGSEAPAEPNEIDEEPWLRVAIVRPSFLTDGNSKGDKNKTHKQPYRIGVDEHLSSYTISRRDISHFIVENLIPNYGTYEGKWVHVGY